MIVHFYNQGVQKESCEPLFSQFPDGQPHVKLIPKSWKYEIGIVCCSIRTPYELFNLRLVVNIIEKHCRCKIEIYWLMGARMDRAIDENQPNTWQCVKEMLPLQHSLGDISVLDFHNWGVFDECAQLPLTSFKDEVLNDFGDCDIVFPDKGAQDRYTNLFNCNILRCKKTRDSQTGKLTGFELESGIKQKEAALIWDDACDGGGTFVGQAQILKALGYKKLGLYTTHGLYSKGMDVLSDFNSIYSTNSFDFGPDTGNKLFLRIHNK